jgi:WD40 repeat protein
MFWNIHSGGAMILKGHTGVVGCVTMSRGGRLAASSGWDNTIRVWDVLEAINSEQARKTGIYRGGEAYVYRGHQDAVTTVVFSHDGQRLLSGSEDKTLRLWDMQTERELVCLRGHEGAVNSVALSGDNRWALSGSSDRTVRLWDVEYKQELCRLEGHTAPVVRVAFCPGGLQAVSGSEDGTIRVWQLPSFEERAKLVAPKP